MEDSDNYLDAERIKLLKKNARRIVKEKTAALSETEKCRQSALLCNRILSSAEYKKSDVVLLFIPLADEVNLTAAAEKALKEGKCVCVPKVIVSPYNKNNTSEMDFFILEKKTLASQLEKGSYGILEPSDSLECLDKKHIEGRNVLVLVPGLSFTEDGKRLGRGKGFYDTYLAEKLTAWNAASVFLWGMCFDCQIAESLPCEEHDILMDRVD